MPDRFLRVPHIRQKAESDCLVACAAMLLTAAGFRVDYNRLRKLLGTTTFGTPASRIQLLARLDSNISIVYRAGTLQDVIDFIDQGYPVAIFVDTKELPYWTYSSYHAVVVVGYSELNFYLNDPAFETAPQLVSPGNVQLARDAYNSKLAVVQRVRKSAR